MKRDAKEAMCNAAVGLIVSWVGTYTLLPLWGFEPHAMASAGITLTFFVLSFIRSWIIRAIFRGAE